MSQPEMGQASEWRVAVKGEQRGPFTLDQVRQMVADGRLPADSLVWKPGMANWASIASVPELSATAARGPVPQPSPLPMPGGPQGPTLGDYLAFRRMITPAIIVVIFWIGVAICVVAGLAALFSSLAYRSVLGVLMALMYLVVGPIMVRVYAELLILLFKIFDTLQEIRDQRK